MRYIVFYTFKLLINSLDRTLTDVRRKQQSVKNAIYLNRQSDSVKGLVDTVKRTKGHYDAARMSTRLDKLDKEIGERIHTNNNSESCICHILCTNPIKYR